MLMNLIIILLMLAAQSHQTLHMTMDVSMFISVRKVKNLCFQRVLLNLKLHMLWRK